MILGEYMSSLQREVRDRREGQKLIPEALILIKCQEKKGLGLKDKNKTKQKNIENRELATSMNEKTISKKRLVNIVKSRILTRRWTVAIRFDI